MTVKKKQTKHRWAEKHFSVHGKLPERRAEAQRKRAERNKSPVFSWWIFIISVEVEPLPQQLSLWTSPDSSRSQVAGLVCSAFIRRCGVKKLKRSVLLFLGFIFSPELLQHHVLKLKGGSTGRSNSPEVKTTSQKAPRSISRMRCETEPRGLSCELQALISRSCQKLCLHS